MTHRFTLIIVTSLIFLCLIPEKVSAAHFSRCLSHESMVDYLKTANNETPVSYGLTTSGLVLEILASPDGTWTIIRSQPNGYTCIVETGEIWTVVPIIDGEKL